MKTIRHLIFFAVFSALVFMLSNCSSGRRAYEKGDYYNAVLLAVNRLKGNTDKEKAQESLQNAYPLAIKSIQEAIQNMHLNNPPFKWAKIVDYYNQIDYLYHQIQSSPGALRVIPNPLNVAEEVVKAKENAANEYYQAAETAMLQGTREGARQAYDFYVKTKEYMPSFKDIDQKIKTAKDQGTMRVMLEPVPNPDYSSGISAFAFQQKLNEFMQSNALSEFVRFYSPAEANNTPYQMDQVLRMQFTNLKLGEVHHYEKNDEIKRDSVQTGTVKEDDVEKPVYATVYAKLKTLKKELTGNGLLRLEILDPIRQETVFNKDFQSQTSWSCEWAVLEGDNRALNDAQLQLCQKKEEPSPNTQKLFDDLSLNLYNQLTPWLSNYYKKN